MVFRRARVTGVSERPRVIEAHEAAEAELGRLVTGENIDAYVKAVTRIIATERVTGPFGRSEVVAPATFLVPRQASEVKGDQRNFGTITVIPFLKAVHPYLVISPKLWPTGMKVTESRMVPLEKIGETIAKEVKSVKTLVNGRQVLSHRKGSAAVLADGRVFIDSRDRENLALERKYPRVSDKYSGSVERAYHRFIGETAVQDAEIGRRVTAARELPSTSSIYTTTPASSFDIGRRTRLTLTQEVIGQFQTDGQGSVLYVPTRDGTVLKWPLVDPFIGGVCDEILAMQAVFGLTAKEPAVINSGLNTGNFSLSPLTPEAVVRICREETKTLSPDIAKEVLQVIGFTPAEAAKKVGRLRIAEFAEKVDQVDWKTGRIPDIVLSSSRLEKTQLFFPDDLEEDNDSENAIIARIAQDTVASITQNDAMALITARFAEMRAIGERADLSVLHTTRMVVGRVFRLELSNRVAKQ
jgi:hypothetical protein